MLFTRNYKKFHLLLSLHLEYNKNIFIGYSNSIMLSKLGYLKAPLFLFNNNMCFFIGLDKFIDKEFEQISLFSYNNYIITNNKLLNGKKVNYFIKNNVTNNLLIIILHYFVKLYYIIISSLYKLLYNILNYNLKY